MVFCEGYCSGRQDSIIEIVFRSAMRMQVSLYGKLAQLWKKMWSHKRVKGLETIINALSLFKDNHIQKS